MISLGKRTSDVYLVSMHASLAAAAVVAATSAVANGVTSFACTRTPPTRCGHDRSRLTLSRAVTWPCVGRMIAHS